ncbi:hypothetical protein BU23DRAFT_482478 [Bimuria novae-zelandiae CBS 107.79]|uniref:USP domain-containing protein n=1 Tax=Bimuria novae-zelandiae CBS 107.79 TaxID=1447943 RepID=A0A6A5UTS6_9PLEO|nr:hypothetical protein BU23DRAFT_482478 [Bimuria novae-zelandiae CBS 107.79]
MSQRDHELMESATAETAISVPASPPLRDSMEDADPSLTRKRPRLDSGSIDTPAMHVDPDFTHHTAAPTPAEQLVQMTIRSQPPSSSHAEDATGSTSAGHANASPGEDILVPAVMDGPPDSSADSPPVIAIDDDDDDDDDDDADTMADYAASFHVEFDADAHMRAFPYDNGNYIHAAQEIAKYFQGNQPLDGTILNQLTIWLEGLPHDPLTWLGFYFDHSALWEEIGAVAGRVLNRRASLGGAFGDSSMSEEEIITRFLAYYLRFAVCLMQVDARMLSEWNSEDPYTNPILCYKHVRHACTILRNIVIPGTVHLFNMMRKEYDADIETMQTQLLQEYLDAEGIKHLLDLANQAHGKAPLIAQHWIVFNTALIMDTLIIFLLDPQMQLPSEVIDQTRLCQDTLAFFRKYDADLQNPNKVVDTGAVKDIITYFHSLLFNICRCDGGMAADLINELVDSRDPESSTVAFLEEKPFGDATYLRDPSEYPKLVSNAWKFKLLRKYIVKGRMELRVMSIGFMDSSLVELWKEYNGTLLSTGHPVMQYLADFLLHERVVDYIISVDSHPQLISRSGNIVGFLVVTHRYSNAQTDAIWNTISHSSDPRVVSATMTMLRGIYHLMLQTDQLYLCSKMYELPISSYTIDILRFLKDLTPKLLGKNIDWSQTDPKARPWNVCIRVLQDTSPSKESTKTSDTLHHEAADQLRAVANFISNEERRQLLCQCASHIASKSPKASGSVRSIYILISAATYGDSGFFAEDPDIVRGIIEEMCAFVKNEIDMPFNAQITGLQYRLELLSLMIYGVSDVIPPDLYQTIWDHLIGKHARTNHHRDLAWSKFLEAVKYKPDNDFCKQLISVCLPELDPLYYTPGMFDFVATYRFPTTRRSITSQEGTKTVLQIRGADLLWAMILSAPPQTIEDRAAKTLASRYIEVDLSEGVTLDELEEAHVALVEQCIKEMLSVYRTLRTGTETEAPPDVDQMDTSSSDPMTQQNEQRFARIVMFLNLLLNFIRNKPELNRSKRSDSKVEPLDVELPLGDSVEINYTSPVTNNKETILIGSENTLQDLYTRLCHAIGCTKLNLFAKGKRLNVLEKPSEKIADIGLGGQVLLVQKAPGAEISRPVLDLGGSSSIFETTVLSHFDELFSCMDADDYISFVLYEFLCCFPFQSAIYDSVTAGTATSGSLFPQDRPWQAKYAANALDNRLKVQVRKNSVDDTFLANTVRLLDEAILSPGLIGQELQPSQCTPLPGVLAGILLCFLKERPAHEISAGYFSDECGLVDRLVKLASIALSCPTDMGLVAYNSYCAMIEASLHSRGIWAAFTNHSDIGPLHSALLLSDHRTLLRDSVARVISSVCGGGLSPTSAITEADTATSFWRLVSAVLPHAIQLPGQSEHLFKLADHVFRKYDEHNRDEASLRSYLKTWSTLLLDYDHEEKVGRDETDFVVIGFTKLLLSCVSSLKSFKKPLNASSLIEKIWRKFLFAPRLVEMDEQSKIPIPVLESNTRKELYDLILALAEDQSSFGVLLDLAENLGRDNPNSNLQALCVDRTNEIRAPTGYVGLFNPRAICYMNSLLTQLFMNINFRKFILRLNVTDPERQQVLLHQTQKLFAEMQNSYRKSADPRSFAACVKAPEGAPIDINIQMDADEFYNLLFDQWEGQMLAPEIKQQFRSFYGGHTINQIKSKECEHVSERVESFFVVQCDVQGKQNLNESLQSFVEGDVMEGDNKYKCESCGGKLVDAVKRTCLKDVPDNLIFHLKRFDFDLVELRRAKINDQFEFPSVIDISPFKMDHLSDPSKPCEEDIFELVGVLVHQGTSENGHYYSYIRERPSYLGNMHPWVEFNDRDVDAFDFSSLGYHTFGGAYGDQFQRQQKQFSAYMLFYQRRAAMAKDHAEYIRTPHSGMAKVPVPPALQHDIDIDNDSLVREYSLYDPNHTKFVRLLLANVRAINHGTCAEDHQQKTQAIHVVLEHLSQTLFRAKNLENFDEAMAQIRKTTLSCATCCLVVLRWFSVQSSALANLLLHCIHPKVRSQIGAFLIESIQFLREKDPVAYGIEAMETDSESGSVVQSDGVLTAISMSLYRVLLESYQTVRGWDDLYLTLCHLSALGPAETAVLLDNDLLEWCLRILCMHAIENCRDPDLWRVVEKKKRIYNRMIEFVYRLLSRVDIHLPAIEKRQVSRMDGFERNGSKFALSRQEKALLYHWHDENRALAFLDKMLEWYDHAKADVDYPGEILKLMLKSVDPRLQQQLFLTIQDGVASLSPPYSNCYIRAALAYCEGSPEPSHVMKVIEVVWKHATKYHSDCGEVTVIFMSGLLKLENEVVMDERGNEFFYVMSFRFAEKAASVSLLYDDEYIRKATAAHLGELFSRHQDDEHTAEDVLKHKYKAVRVLSNEFCDKIVYEYQHSTARSYMQPMIGVCEMLVGLLSRLYESDDPALESCKHTQDWPILEKWQSQVVPRMQNWPVDESTPVSTGEPYDHSDYGSESDLDPELIDLEE